MYSGIVESDLNQTQTCKTYRSNKKKEQPVIHLLQSKEKVNDENRVHAQHVCRGI